MLERTGSENVTQHLRAVTARGLLVPPISVRTAKPLIREPTQVERVNLTVPVKALVRLARSFRKSLGPARQV